MGIPDVRPTTTRPRAGLLCALSLLAIVTVLAGTLGWTRRSVSHGHRISPEGWTISFTVPKHWTPRDVPSRSGQTIAFVEPIHRGRERVLLVHRRPNTDFSTPDAIAQYCLLEWAYQGLGELFMPSGVRAVPAPFGPLVGARITNGNVFVSAGVHESNAYCVGLYCDRLITPEDLQIAERVVESTEIER